MAWMVNGNEPGEKGRKENRVDWQATKAACVLSLLGELVGGLYLKSFVSSDGVDKWSLW